MKGTGTSVGLEPMGFSYLEEHVLLREAFKDLECDLDQLNGDLGQPT